MSVDLDMYSQPLFNEDDEEIHEDDVEEVAVPATVPPPATRLFRPRLCKLWTCFAMHTTTNTVHCLLRGDDAACGQ